MCAIESREAIPEALREALTNDPRVFLMGEDVGLYGGCYAVTKGLLEEFGPERIRDMPLSESAENVRNNVFTADLRHQFWVDTILNEFTFQYLVQNALGAVRAPGPRTWTNRSGRGWRDPQQMLSLLFRTDNVQRPRRCVVALELFVVARLPPEVPPKRDALRVRRPAMQCLDRPHGIRPVQVYRSGEGPEGGRRDQRPHVGSRDTGRARDLVGRKYF